MRWRWRSPPANPNPNPSQAEAEDAMRVEESEAAQPVQQGVTSQPLVQREGVPEEPAAATALLNATVALDEPNLGEPG